MVNFNYRIIKNKVLCYEGWLKLDEQRDVYIIVFYL